VGHNCGSCRANATDRRPITRITAALRERVPITEVLLNYRRDGTAFWNQVSISPVFDGAGELVNFVGVQNDVTERVIVEQERRAALAEAEEARAELRLLAEATTEMTAAPRRRRRLRRLARMVVPQLADLCAVDCSTGRARAPPPGGRGGTGPGRRGGAAPAGQAAPLPRRSAGATGAVLAGGEPRCWPSCPTAGADRYPDDPEAADAFERAAAAFGDRRAAAAPVAACSAR
jgi:hypothetical protein